MAPVTLLLTLLMGHLVTAQTGTTPMPAECISREIRTVTQEAEITTRSGMTKMGPFDYVQYCVRGEWRMLCGDDMSLWRDQEAMVACRQLGYSGGTQISFRSGNTNKLTSTFFKFRANCNSNESAVHQCGGDVEELDIDSCGFGFYGIVDCFNDITDGEIRLVDGSTGWEGRVEVRVDGRWGTVCNNQEGLAGAVCSQLRFPAEGAQQTDKFGPGVVPIRNCTVQNGRLSCTEVTDLSCNHTMDLGVVCTCQDAPQMSEANKPAISMTTTASVDTCMSGPGVITPALGAVIGLLVVVLMIAIVGWIITCIKLSRSSDSPRKNNAGGRTVRNQSYSLQHGQHTEAPPPIENYSSEGPIYSMADSNTEDLGTYNRLNHNQQTPVQPEPFQSVDPVPSNDDDFYNAEEHTYAMVPKKKGKKKEKEGPPVSDMTQESPMGEYES